jgi:hypothetical protein
VRSGSLKIQAPGNGPANGIMSPIPAGSRFDGPRSPPSKLYLAAVRSQLHGTETWGASETTARARVAGPTGADGKMGKEEDDPW